MSEAKKLQKELHPMSRIQAKEAHQRIRELTEAISKGERCPLHRSRSLEEEAFGRKRDGTNESR